MVQPDHEKFFGSYEVNGLGGGIFSRVICVLMVFPPWKKTEKHFKQKPSFKT